MSSNRQLRLWLGLAVLFVAVPGCSNDQPPPQRDQTSQKQSDIPEDWDHIRISEGTNGVLTSYVITGKNQSLESAIKAIKNRFTKPIKYADDVDATRKIPTFRIEVKNGMAVELLAKVAETFNCQMEETGDAFVLKKQPKSLGK